MKLVKSILSFSSMTLFSRVFGLIRDMVLARFGANEAMDAFFVAFRIPNFLRRLFAEGSFSLAFVPVLAEYKERGDHAALKRLVDDVTGSLAAVLLMVTGLGVLAAPWVISVFAPGFTFGSEQHALASDMLRLTFPYLFFIALTALAGGIMNTFERFMVPAVTPVLLNISLISAALLLAPRMDQPVMALALGVLVAGVLQLAFQLPSLQKLGMLPKPRWGFANAGVKKVMKLMVPTLFGSSVAQINLLFDTLVASMLVSGSVTWLYYSDRLLEFPLGLLGVALGTVILPKLSSLHARTDERGYSATLDWGLRMAVLVGLPASVGLALCAKPLLSTLFLGGQFEAADVGMSALSLVAIAGGLPAYLLIKVLAPAFYSRQDTLSPVKAAVLALLANVVFSVLLMAAVLLVNEQITTDALFSKQLFVVMGQFPGLHACLALASALSGWVNVTMLAWLIRRHRVYRPQSGWLVFVLRVLLATAVMAAGVWWLLTHWNGWFDWAHMQRISHLAGTVLLGCLLFGLALWASGMRLGHLREPRLAGDDSTAKAD